MLYVCLVYCTRTVIKTKTEIEIFYINKNEAVQVLVMEVGAPSVLGKGSVYFLFLIRLKRWYIL